MFSKSVLLNSSQDESPESSFEKRKRYDEIAKLIQEEGLESFLKKSHKFGFGKDLFLNTTELLQFALMAQQHQIEKKIPLQTPTHDFATSPHFDRHPIVKEQNGEGMLCIYHLPFESWEGTVKNTPAIVFFPRSIKGIQNLTRWANQEGKRVRASGYRHSSSEVYSEDNEVLVSMLDLNLVTTLPAQYKTIDPNNDLQGIELVGDEYIKEGRKKIRCKIGAATCNYHFQDWVHDTTTSGGQSKWALPLNVIMTEISFGGSNAQICHGGGIQNQTLSDLVTEIEFINVFGDRQIITDKEQLKAAAGCFGLLGIVISLTVELDEMTYANFKTVEKKLVALTIPPPPDYTLSNALQKGLSKKNIDALADLGKQKEAFTEFVNNAQNLYYSEWFWFPLQDKCWINCWHNDGNKSAAVRYPGALKTERERAESYLAYLANNIMGDELPLLRRIQTKIMGDIAMANMPNKEETVCTLEDALHFRQGIQNIKTRMMEIEIPIPDKSSDGTPDWSICQKAWWDVIESVYSEKNMTYFPMRTTLEMRIMGGSEIIMASQHGNKQTCSIEILTPISVNEERWNAFLQEILDKWSELKDDKGNYLNIRPHWAKRFNELKINRNMEWGNEWTREQKTILQPYLNSAPKISIPMEVYLKTIAYKNQLSEFRERLNSICKAGGYTIEDVLARFSNPLFDNLLAPPVISSLFNTHTDFQISNLNSYQALNRYVSKKSEKWHHKESAEDLMKLLTNMNGKSLEESIDLLERNNHRFQNGFFFKTSLFKIVPTKIKLLDKLLNDLYQLRQPKQNILNLGA